MEEETLKERFKREKKEANKRKEIAIAHAVQVADRDEVQRLWIDAKKHLSKKHYCWWVEKASLWLREDMTNGQLNVLKSNYDLWR